MNYSNAYVICDLQYGSTGKGLMAGYMAETQAPDVVVHAFGPNSGHTYVDREGRKFIHCMLANGIVSPKVEYLLIGPGACVSIQTLIKEMDDCRDILYAKDAQVLIHPHAAIVQPRHIKEEGGSMTSIGSTKKGTGAAMVEKIRRQPTSPTSPPIIASELKKSIELTGREYGVPLKVCTARTYNEIIDKATLIQVEGSQGYSLGLNSGFYPYVTSRECTPAQLASDTLLPLTKISQIVGCMRTYPIRVANRYDEKGNQIGWSGPCYEDQEEITFESIGQEPELTTVTKLPRRIFTFSKIQTHDALRLVMPTDICLGFVNYCSEAHAQELITDIERIAANLMCGGVRWTTHGPTFNDVREVD